MTGDFGLQCGAAPDASSSLVVLLFDVAAMSPDDTKRAADAATKFVESTGPDNLVSIVTISPTTLRGVTDFTADHAVLSALLQSPELLKPAARTLIQRPSTTTRLDAITTVCQTLAALQQRKAMMYLSAAIA